MANGVDRDSPVSEWRQLLGDLFEGPEPGGRLLTFEEALPVVRETARLLQRPLAAADLAALTTAVLNTLAAKHR